MCLDDGRTPSFWSSKRCWSPLASHAIYTDGWGAYERHVEAEQHTVGKENTQKIESKHINLRTRIKRLVRRTICFSKTERMHDLVIGLFINRYEFGVQSNTGSTPLEHLRITAPSGRALRVCIPSFHTGACK